MNKTAIKNFAIWARRKLISDITYKAGMLGITENGIAEPLAISTSDLQFFDVGTKDYAEVAGNEIIQRKALVEAIKGKEKDTKSYKEAFEYITEEVAYTWFNRLIAIRFMEVNDYLPSGIRVLSSENSAKSEPDFVTMPFDTDLEFTPYEQDKVIQLKDENKLDELFRMLFIKQCNKLHDILPELFEKTDDYTELLLNISFTDSDGVVYHLVHDIPQGDFDISKEGQVEIIGWLYQYYNTEQNEMVYDGSFSKSRIPKELLSAATTIYTPDWAVKYMVENSLGRLWLEGHPNDALKSEWKYYLDEAPQEADVQKQLDEIRAERQNINPEEIKIIDPCMGSGHILVYAFDVLMRIYESYGYTQRDAARSILKNNLYGIDIDDRAYQLAYFAVMMKARQYNRRILTEDIKPNICYIRDTNALTSFESGAEQITLDDRYKEIANYLITVFKDAKEYGSIIDVKNMDYEGLKQYIDAIKDDYKDDIFTYAWIDNITRDEKGYGEFYNIIHQAQILSQKYDVVCTNPPYLGSSRFSPKLDKYAKDNYKDEKSDLSMMMYRHAINGFAKRNAYIAFITTSSWMFLSSFKQLRTFLHNNTTINTLVDFGTELFDGKVGHNPIVAWITYNQHINYKMTAIRLVDYCYSRRNEKHSEFFKDKNKYTANQADFSKIPGLPVAYWVSDNFIKAFDRGISIDSISDYTGSQNKTANNELYLRKCWEVKNSDIGKGKRWIFYAKGGDYRKHYGNMELVVDWSENARFFYKNNPTSNMLSERYWYQEGITYTMLTSKGPNFRYLPPYCAFDMGGPAICYLQSNLYYILALLNTKVTQAYLQLFNPTINLQAKDVKSLPIIIDERQQHINNYESRNVSLSKKDWDSFETSWDFKKHPLINREGAKIYRSWDYGKTVDIKTDKDNIQWDYLLSHAYESWERECEDRFNQLKANEEELNRIFIDIYGLQDELTPEVEDKDVTVRKADLQRDIKSLISYAVGCMFGRYSLDKEGLIYAGGEWDDSKYKTFIPDDDNCIPITDGAYFGDDIVGRFEEFLRVAYGDATLEENLDFIAKAVGNKGNTSREIIRNYFLNDFIKDHIKTYQKRPIYWLYDSGKQNGFKALVYMHRYNADTTGNLRVEYLHRIQRVYEKEMERMQEIIDNSSDSRQITTATKRKEKLQKQLKETKEYDAKVAHLALSRIAIDLDDGVKVNYEKVQTASDGTKLQILAKI